MRDKTLTKISAIVLAVLFLGFIVVMILIYTTNSESELELEIVTTTTLFEPTKTAESSSAEPETVDPRIAELEKQIETLENKLAICSQAFYDLQPAWRAYFDAMRNYQSAYVLDSAEAEQYAIDSEQQADELYAEQHTIFGKHCSDHVRNLRPDNWG